ncbi:hypothetical protein BGI30_02905 [Snodgrassella alvi]|uniref:hypothetical protein n=1 Tax=Snodgrassella alvi TaxID=1196083 RepID=UPI000C1E8D9F|nr:hypothetical protein [Snodgrassella alvi]PIT12211.1 hypothetical protein BGI30_02905 [Snodgrassella alvi]PIT57176.1 hypothetical protein BHC59_04505 [Snodgrassella alvi]
MKVTIKWMKGLNANEDDLASFEECIPTDGADQLFVLDKCAELSTNHFCDKFTRLAEWLISYYWLTN